MAKLADLTVDQLRELDSDIAQRFSLQRAMAANTKTVLEMELGISATTIRNIEVGEYQFVCPYKVSAKVRHEVRTRRGLWHLAHEAMEGFTPEALGKKHGLNYRAVENRIKHCRIQQQKQFRQEAMAA